MTIQSGTFASFTAGSGGGNREDLIDTIFNISRRETPFLSMAGKVKARANNHEWLTDALRPAASNAQLEGDVLTFSTRTAASRLANATQISYKTVSVTETQIAVNTAGRRNEMIYQLMLANAELRRDQEWAFMQNQTPVTAGSSGTGTARALRPIVSWMSTNVQAGAGGSNGSATTARTNGTQRALDESLFQTGLRTAWAAGGNPDVCFVGPFNKQRISTFAGNVTKMQDTSEAKVVTNIDLYKHDFGVIKVVPNHVQRDRDVHLLDMSYWRCATLRQIQTIDLARVADAENAYIVTEYTLESGNEAASALIADCTDS